MAVRLSALDARNIPVAHWGKYNGEYHFTGRLKTPLNVLFDMKALTQWMTAHPEGYVLIVSSRLTPEVEHRADFFTSYRSERRIASLWKAQVLSAEPALLAHIIPGEIDNLHPMAD